jgi:DNA polymerase III delta' subunit
MDLPGQDHVVRALTNALSNGRLAHALLFSGPAGSGREKAARGLAAALVCENGAIPFGCGACRGCKRAVSGHHPDVHVLMPEVEAVRRGLAEPDGKRKPSSDILVDTVRDLTLRLRMAPYEGGARVAIVLDAHRMNDNAQNALLKTLEEPAPATFLVLTAPHERTVLPTIASRCLRLAFAPVQKGDDVVGTAETTDSLFHALTAGSAREKLDTAEAMGKERTDVDAALAALSTRIAEGMRADAVWGEGAVSWRRAAELLEKIAAAREAIGQNASVQLCLEELLLGAAPR